MTDGDLLERQAWVAFAQSEFPSYETFWLRHVAPLTNRPANIRFKSDAELANIGKGHEHLCVAQLNYSVLWHLMAADNLRRQAQLTANDLTHCVIRLMSASDVADEMQERHTTIVTNPSSTIYGPWDESDGQKARYKWRGIHKTQVAPLDPVRTYRNHLAHGRISMGLIPADRIARFPKIGEEASYLDWRKAIAVAGSPADLARDFDTGKNIAEAAWRLVLDYLEVSWKALP